MKAIGLLETKGLIGNIEGLDAMMKAAQVDYVGGLTLGAGLVAMVVTGDVGRSRPPWRRAPPPLRRWESSSAST